MTVAPWDSRWATRRAALFLADPDGDLAEPTADARWADVAHWQLGRGRVRSSVPVVLEVLGDNRIRVSTAAQRLLDAPASLVSVTTFAGRDLVALRHAGDEWRLRSMPVGPGPMPTARQLRYVDDVRSATRDRADAPMPTRHRMLPSRGWLPLLAAAGARTPL
ncbi:MAG TPA: hypothetical protein P5181_04345 [Dermatophilaceae bacterium]|nr:hypothetical protein [Dermatophilaceae bacterium]